MGVLRSWPSLWLRKGSVFLRSLLVLAGWNRFYYVMLSYTWRRRGRGNVVLIFFYKHEASLKLKADQYLHLMKQTSIRVVGSFRSQRSGVFVENVS